MRALVVVFLTALLLTSLPAQASHTAAPTKGPGDDLTQVIHDCSGEDHVHDLGALYAGSATRTYDHDANAQTPDAAVHMVLLQVIIAGAAPTDVSSGAVLVVEFEADSIHPHATVIETEDDWTTTHVRTTAEDSRSKTMPIFVSTYEIDETNPTAPPGTPLSSTYYAIELGYPAHAIFAPGPDTAAAPLVMAKWQVRSYEFPGTDDDLQDTMPGTGCGAVANPKTFIALGPSAATITATPAITDRVAGSKATFKADITPVDGDPGLDKYTYAWKFTNGDDIQTSTAAEPQMHFTKLGAVDVELKVTDDLGSQSTFTTAAAATVEAVPPIASFTVSPLAPTAGQDITFTDTSLDPDGDAIAAWSWDFTQDGVEDADTATATHKYANAGSYVVRLTVTDDQGKAATRELRVFVCTEADKAQQNCQVPNAGPVAAFTADPLIITQGESIQFTDASSDPDGTIEAWAWDFGEGNTSAAQNPLQVFEEIGTFQVRLTVTDDGGLQGIRAKPVRVLLREPEATGPKDLPEPPIAAFTYAPEDPVVGVAVTFSDATHSESVVEAWTWFFGDGSDAATGKSTKHTFDEAGNYRVRLVVTDENGVMDSAEQVITIGSGVTDGKDSPGLPAVFLLGALATVAAVLRRKD